MKKEINIEYYQLKFLELISRPKLFARMLRKEAAQRKRDRKTKIINIDS
jgi:hypothetical protein